MPGATITLYKMSIEGFTTPFVKLHVSLIISSPLPCAPIILNLFTVSQRCSIYSSSEWFSFLFIFVAFFFFYTVDYDMMYILFYFSCNVRLGIFLCCHNNVVNIFFYGFISSIEWLNQVYSWPQPLSLPPFSVSDHIPTGDLLMLPGHPLKREATMTNSLCPTVLGYNHYCRAQQQARV